jgi:hypothetical protein
MSTPPGGYSIWIGRPVNLRVVAGEFQTILHCTVIGESKASLRVRISGVWDVEIYKEMVMAVEEVEPGSGPFLVGEDSMRLN